MQPNQTNMVCFLLQVDTLLEMALYHFGDAPPAASTTNPDRTNANASGSGVEGEGTVERALIAASFFLFGWQRPPTETTTCDCARGVRSIYLFGLVCVSCVIATTLTQAIKSLGIVRFFGDSRSARGGNDRKAILSAMSSDISEVWQWCVPPG